MTLPMMDERMRRTTQAVLGKVASASSYVFEEALRAARASLYFTSHTIDGELLPTFKSLSEISQDITSSWLDTVAGKKDLAAHVKDMGERAESGRRYEKLVHELGGSLFGSAVYDGEEVILANDVYKLSYLPAKEGVEPAGPAVFFLAGFIPYGDRLFRFLPEANLFDRFLERGVPVYLMELVGDKDQIRNMGQVTVDRQIAWIDEMAGAAFRHNQGRKMIAIGYCGSGLQLIAYLAARAADADAKFKSAALFVTPVDAAKCNILAEMVANLPRTLVSAALRRSQILGGYLRGLEMWAALDTSLKNVFSKTALGRFATGWKKPAFSKVRFLADLDPKQRFELAAAYWISVKNAERFPLPVDLVRRASWLYDKGVGENGELGFEYQGEPVTLKTIADKSSIRLTAFFAGLDPLVQGESGHVLKKFLGDRYQQITHPTAAHVSYICFPMQWNAALPGAFLPNPLDVLIADWGK
jgi:hypothetical protein